MNSRNKRLLCVREGVAGLALSAAAAWLSGCVAPQAQTETAYDWRTLSGLPGGLGNVDGAGEAARFCQPCAVALDAAGNLYVADYYNYAIRKVAPDGAVTTLAGSVGEPGGADGVGSAARFDRPSGLAVDGAGVVYVADSGNHTVRRVTPDGAVSTLAGRAGEPGSADATGRDARFRSPLDVAVDGAGNVYVADAYNHVVRKITSAGAVSTLAGKVEIQNGSAVGGFADGKGSAAKFRAPRGVAVDGSGNVYVADTENALIRKVAPDGTVKTLAGGAGSAGYANGTNGVARFSNPQGLCVDASGNVFVADTGNLVIRKVSPAGSVSTVTNGLARFPMPRDVAVDKAGNLVVADNESQVIRVIAARGGVSVRAGCESRHGSTEGAAGVARFNRPAGLAVDAQGWLTVADNFSQTLRRVSPDGVVTTLAGRAWSMGGSDGTGTNATFFWPAGLARDRAGNVYVADAGNHTVRKVTPAGAVATVAGAAGVSGYADGARGQARFAGPSDVACDKAGTVYVADRANHAIRKVTPAGEVTTLAGAAGKSGRADGVGGSALFNNPSGVAVDAVGNVYVADTGSHTVRKIVPGGEVTTLAGCAGVRGSADGRGSVARFNGPSDLEADEAGNVYVADRDNHLIRRIAPDGGVTTLGGLANAMTCTDGLGVAARFAQPSGLALGADGALYVADACNNRIAVGVPCAVSRSVRPLATRRTAVSAQAVPAERETAYRWEVFAGQPGQPGVDDGRGAAARLSGPQGLALAADGALFVADSRAGAIRKVSPDGGVTTVARAGAALRAPVALAVERGGSLVVVDGGRTLWRVSASGEATKLAGEAAPPSFVSGVAADAAGTIVAADQNAHVLRRVAADGAVTVCAGRAGLEGTVDGVGSAALFAQPTAVAADGRGGWYVATANAIRKVSAEGAVTTVKAGCAFGRLDGIAVDGAGNVYAADRGRHTIWKVALGGQACKLGGSELAMGGAGWLVTGLAVDRAGNVYVADAVRNCVMKGAPDKGR